MAGLNCVLANIGRRSGWKSSIQALIVSGYIAVLAGCGISRQVEQGEAAPVPAKQGEADPAPANLNDALAGCRNGYPDQITQAVVRAACVIKATELLRPLLPFPDMLDQENNLRKSLAEQVQSGKISLLERNRQMAKFHAKMLAEEQVRLQEKPAEVVSTSLAATQWRISNPDGCTSLGANTANCY
jgi:hypothetical protein